VMFRKANLVLWWSRFSKKTLSMKNIVFEYRTFSLEHLHLLLLSLKRY